MEKTLLETLADKFTKANVYAVLVDLDSKSKSGSDISKEFAELIEISKPQKGGGATANPMQVIDGVNYHYCRFAQDYIPESEINMTNGKSKGTGILASKIAYRIGKAADVLRDEAMAAFIAGDYTLGGELNGKADSLRLEIDKKENFTAEAMEVSEYHPDFGKEKNEENQTQDAVAETTDVI